MRSRVDPASEDLALFFLAPLAGEARARLLEALDKVDAFAARVARTCGADLACGAGCTDCCVEGLRLRPVEAAYLAEGVAAGARPRQPGPATSCPLLLDGRCLAYAHRPALCRTHGLPILRREGREAIVHHCPHNFVAREARLLPPELLLDEERLAMLLDAVDALYCRETGWTGGRVEVTAIARAGLQA